MEIEIIPVKLSDNLFEEYHNELLKLQSANYCYVTNIEVITKLISMDMPISNKRLAIKNVLNFLTHIDTETKVKDSTLLSLSCEVLISYFSRDHYKRYMKILEDLEIFTNVPYDDGTFYKFTPNQKTGVSKQYRLHNSYIQNTELCIVILEEDRAKKGFVCDLDLDPRYIKTIKDLEVNMRDAIIDEVTYCKENNLSSNNLRVRLSRLFYTRMKRFIKKGKNVERIYHSFSTLSKVSRRHLNIKMYNIDITNSQPLILVSYLLENNLPYDANYKIDCENGDFYNRFINDKYLVKDDTKVPLYKGIFFNFNTISIVNKKFKELYPLTWNSLNEIHNTNISLAQRLQNHESELFNNLIPVKSKNYFTLFDSIYFDNINDITDLLKKIHKFFNDRGVNVTTKIEY